MIPISGKGKWIILRWSPYLVKVSGSHYRMLPISTYTFKIHFFSTRPSDRAQIWHACADRDETGSHLKQSWPTPPHSDRNPFVSKAGGRPSGGCRPEAADRPLWTNQLCAASLRFLEKCYSININALSLWRKCTSHQTTYPWK